MIIKRIGPVSCARIFGTLYAIIGFFIGALFSLLALIGSSASQTTTANRGVVTAAVGVASVILFPLIYGAFGFVSTLVIAWLYNLLAAFVGGIQIDVQSATVVAASKPIESIT